MNQTFSKTAHRDATRATNALKPEQSERDPISSILLQLIGRDGVIGLVLERAVRFCSRLRSFTSLVFARVGTLYYWIFPTFRGEGVVMRRARDRSINIR